MAVGNCPNDHVVDDGLEYSTTMPDKKTYKLEIISGAKEHKNHDLAIVSFKSKRDYTSLDLVKEGADVLLHNEPVAFAGYPAEWVGGEDNHKGRYKQAGTDSYLTLDIGTFNAKGDSRSNYPKEGTEKLWFDSIASAGGASGAPIVNKDGKLVAITNRLDWVYTGGVPINEVRDSINKVVAEY
ncbi:MAG: serine protease [Candidatus Caenarcaniphilales bacterium]|nr:serine protease [Candidatus Caenarcaniphilales bacterium]